jgi:hypothetical protein
MLKIAAIWPAELWNTKLSPTRRHTLIALGRRDDVDLHITGPGFPRWIDTDPAQNNIERLCGRVDACIMYKPLEYLVAPEKLKLLRVVRFNECWWPDDAAYDECRRVGAGLIICHHANDVPRFKLRSDCVPVVVHVPHAAERSVFYDGARSWEERDIDVLLTGTINEQFYPLRARWLKLIRSGKFPSDLRVVHHPHPGKRAADIGDSERKVREYAELLKRSKLVLGCTSKFRYALARFPEAMAAGAVPVTDLPHDAAFVSTASNYVVAVSADWSDEDLVQNIVLQLTEHVDMNVFRSRILRSIYCEHYTTEIYARLLRNAVVWALNCES